MRGPILLLLLAFNLAAFSQVQRNDFTYAEGKKKPFNCLLLNKIINKIEAIREIKEASKNAERYSQNKAKSDSLDNRLYAETDSWVPDDSLFYLTETNIILDTFMFFSQECSFQRNKKKFIVLNYCRDTSKYSNFNLIWVSSLNSREPYFRKEKRQVGFSGVCLQHRSAKSKFDIAAFYYQTVQNTPVIKKVEVVKRNQLDIENK